jgi:hypothetical protein
MMMLISGGLQIGLQGCDSLIFCFDGERLLAYVSFNAAPLHLRDFGADVNLRYAINALLGK